MDNGKLDPRSLNAEERALVDMEAFYEYHSASPVGDHAACFRHAFELSKPAILARRAIFGDPASEGGKVECPNCGGEAAYFDEHHDGYEFLCAPCKPAQPEHLFTCRNCGKGYDCDEGEHYIFASGLYACLPPKPAQPEPVAADTFATDRAIGAQVADASALEPVAAEMPDSGRIHELKCWRGPFAELLAGRKTFEYRKDDRRFEVGDSLVLRQWDEVVQAYTSERVNTLHARVTHILRAPNFGVPDGFVVLSLGGVRTDDGDVDRSQPAPAVAMTEELEVVLRLAAQHVEGWQQTYQSPEYREQMLSAIAAVRAQAAEAGKVTLPKVNEALWLLRKRAMEKKDLEVIKEAQREVNAAEGRK